VSSNAVLLLVQDAIFEAPTIANGPTGRHVTGPRRDMLGAHIRQTLAAWTIRLRSILWA